MITVTPRITRNCTLFESYDCIFGRMPGFNAWDIKANTPAIIISFNSRCAHIRAQCMDGVERDGFVFLNNLDIIPEAIETGTKIDFGSVLVATRSTVIWIHPSMNMQMNEEYAIQIVAEGQKLMFLEQNAFGYVARMIYPTGEYIAGYIDIQHFQLVEKEMTR